jgi:hypothetical protein
MKNSRSTSNFSNMAGISRCDAGICGNDGCVRYGVRGA